MTDEGVLQQLRRRSLKENLTKLDLMLSESMICTVTKFIDTLYLVCTVTLVNDWAYCSGSPLPPPIGAAAQRGPWPPHS